MNYVAFGLSLVLFAANAFATIDPSDIAMRTDFTNCKNDEGSPMNVSIVHVRDGFTTEPFLVTGSEEVSVSQMGGCMALSCPQGFEASDSITRISIYREGHTGSTGKSVEGQTAQGPFTCDLPAEEAQASGGAASMGGL